MPVTFRPNAPRISASAATVITHLMTRRNGRNSASVKLVRRARAVSPRLMIRFSSTAERMISNANGTADTSAGSSWERSGIWTFMPKCLKARGVFNRRLRWLASGGARHSHRERACVSDTKGRGDDHQDGAVPHPRDR
jgi:hypothetical protein